MIIRDMTFDDYQDVDELMQQLHNIHVKGRPDLYREMEHPYSKEEYEELVRNLEVVSILAEEDARIAGLCIVCLRDRSGMVEMKTAYMDDLIVSESYRGRGIASRLFSEAEKRVKLMGAKRRDLMVWSFNDDARAFYEAQGMTPQRFIYEKEL